MNFLLHRQLALRELGESAAGIGAMLPDLWRIADRRVRAREHAAVSDAHERALQLGVDHHLEADRWFHRTEVFHRGERATCEALLALEVPKLGRFGHIAWELCLDGASVADTLEESLRSLRTDLEGTEDALWTLSLHHGADRLEPFDRARFRQRLGRIVSGLCDGDWIAGYATGEGLAERLEGIRGRLGLDRLEAGPRDALGAVLERRLDAARHALDPLHRARRDHLVRREVA